MQQLTNHRKASFQGRSNATRVKIEPRSCNQACCKNAFTILTTLLLESRAFLNRLLVVDHNQKAQSRQEAYLVELSKKIRDLLEGPDLRSKALQFQGFTYDNFECLSYDYLLCFNIC